MKSRNTAIALVAAAGMLAPAVALHGQSSQQRQEDTSRQTQTRQQRANQDRQDRMGQQRQNQDRQGRTDQNRYQNRNQNRDQNRDQNRYGQNRNNQGRYQLDWDSTTIIGYDLNGDGVTDTYYAASSYDIDRMNRQMNNQRRQMSQGDHDRMRQEVDRRRAGNRSNRQGANWDMSQANPRKTVQGTVKSLENFQLTGQNQPRTVARVETNNGERIAVVLGTQREMQGMDLEPGDTLRFQARKGSIDNRRVLVADRVTINGQTKQIRQQKAEDLLRIQGKIVDTKTVSLQNRDGQGQEKLFLKVRNQNGQTRCVLLGPTSRIDPERYERGETISVLAAPTRVNGRQVFAARQINYDGQSKVLSTAGQPQLRSR